MTYEIMLIKPEKALEIIEAREPQPLILAIAKDGDMYTDEAHDIDECIQRLAETIHKHTWYQDETIEKCRELAEYQIMKLREGAKRNEKTR